MNVCKWVTTLAMAAAVVTLAACEGGSTSGESDVGIEGTDADVLADDALADDALVDGDAQTTDVSVGPATCQSDKDCTAEGQVCDPLTKVCVPCLTDSECKAGEHCVGLLCQGYTGCSNSLGCKAAKGPDGKDQPICDQKIGECTACLTATDCPESNDCIAKACVPYKSCNNSTECGKDEVCDKAAKRCVQCLGDVDCPKDALCEAGKCHAFTPCASDKQCTAAGLLCDSAKGKCAQCLVNNDCPDIYNCQKVGVGGTGTCVLDVCAQGQGACSSNAKVTCNAVGDGYGSPQPCGVETTCTAPGGKPECAPWVCKPGTNCEGAKVLTCTEDGLSIEKTEDCAANAGKCVAGACQPIVCAASTTYCDGQTVKLCAADGLSASTTQACNGSQFCASNGNGSATCQAQICKPGAAVCDGSTPGTCKVDGSGITPSGADCALADQVCVAGACQAKICLPGQAFCDGTTVKLCDAQGLTATVQKSCGANEFCSAGKCNAQVCTPNQPACDGQKPGSCNADGSGIDTFGVDCAAKGKECHLGNCVTKVCVPATQYCDGSTLKTCSPDGFSVTNSQACGVGYFCGANKTGDAGCQPVICDPGKATCNGTTATTCNADGSGFVVGGTDCTGSGKVCSAGVCKSLLCDPQNPLYCSGKDSMKCDATGLSPSKLQTCGAGFYCASGACSAQICAPGTSACAGNKPATCNADGSGYSTIGAECGAGKTCEAGVCNAQVCGNGVVEGAEDCDDGNVWPGDGCSATCKCSLDGALSVHGGTCTAGGCGYNPSNQMVKVDVPQSYSGQPAATVEIWARLDATSQYGKLFYGSDYDLQIGYAGDAGFGANQGKWGSSWAGVSIASIAPAVPGSWHHFALVFNAGTVSFFIDGQLQGQASSPSATTVPTIAGGAMTIGGSLNMSNPNANEQFNGAIRAFRVSKSALYTGTFQPPAGFSANPAALQVLALDEVSGTSAADAVAGGGAGAVLNGAGWTAAGAIGGCAAALAKPSCSAWLTSNPSLPDGVYPIDPDGAGPIAAANLFCDMKNGGLTLVANIYDSAGDDAPNTTDYIVSGWQQTASGAWANKASTVDRAWGGGTGSAAVSLAFVAALKASAGQANLKMCFVHQNGTDTVCRNSADGSMTLVSFATGNPKLTVYSGDKLTYTFGRLAGLAGSVDGYDISGLLDQQFCIPRTAGLIYEIGTDVPGFCDILQPQWPVWSGAWHGWGNGISYRPVEIDASELRSGTAVTGGLQPNPNLNTYGFRLYIGPQPVCGNGVKETGEGCDDGNTTAGDGCSAVCQLEAAWTKLADYPLDSLPPSSATTNGGWQGQGSGTVGGRTAWLMNSDNNNVWVPTPSGFFTQGDFAVEVDVFVPAGTAALTFAIGGVPAQFMSVPAIYAVSTVAPSGPMTPLSAYAYPVSSTPGASMSNAVKPGQWSTLRLESNAKAKSLSYLYDGVLIGALSVDSTGLPGTHVNLGGNTTCCSTPLGLGWSNLRFYTGLTGP